MWDTPMSRTDMEVKENDLRSITRNSDTCLTTVYWRPGEAWNRESRKWLLFGEAQLRKCSNDGDMVWWRLASYLKGRTADFEHDSAFALRIPLVAFEFIYMERHRARFVALVHPGMPDEFHVPLPGYNPLEHLLTHPCPTCTDGDAHLIVPEGLYVPPFEPELYKAMAGRVVDITIGGPTE